MEPFVRAQEVPSLLKISSWMPFGDISAGFTGRGGGRGSAPYDSFNAALHVGDNPSTVLANRQLLAETLGFRLEDWTCGEQVHGCRVATVTAKDKGRGARSREDAFADTDGLITDVPGVLLTSFYADCVPLYFYDPVAGAVGLAHAGWKGTVLEIARMMVIEMERIFGSRPEHVRAAIGPSIGACCYEVDETVLKRVRSLEGVHDDKDWQEAASVLAPSASSDKAMLNLKELNRRIMIKAGILPSHIECTTWCTSCSVDIFFSHRKENGITGRMTSWIGLKES